MGAAEIAKALGIGRRSVYRMLDAYKTEKAET
jgi:DNA-binding transcriptional regulator LsrR (DeoR family)